MKRRILLLALLVCWCATVFAQEKSYPSGGYKNLKELNSGIPSGNEAFSIFRRTSENLVNYGGNDYNIVLEGNLNSYKKVWRRYFAIASGDTLYLNCKKLDIGVGFTPVLVKGKFFVFKAYMPQTNTVIGQEINEASANRQPGTVASSTGAPKKQFPFLWALDTANGQKYMLTYGGMLRVLEAYPELKNHFMQDEGKDREDVMMEYIRKANSR